MNTIIYNTTTDWLLEWGQTFFQKRKFSGYLEEIAEELLAEDEERLTEAVKEGTRLILSEIEQASRILTDPAIIGATPENEHWYDAEPAFFMLDHGVYLSEAVDKVIRKRFPELADALLSQLDERLKQVTETLYQPGFSALRLASFNEMRRDMLAGIQEKHHYLFPWYDRGGSLDPQILDDLAASFHILGDENARDRIPEKVEADLLYYLSEIGEDPQLREYLDKQNRLELALKQTVETYWGISLLQAVKAEACRRPLSNRVSEIGVKKLTELILSKYQKPADKLVMDIGRACFAPGISQEDRLSILADAQAELPNIEESPDCVFRDCFELIKQVDARQADVRELASDLITRWIDQLSIVAAEQPEKQSFLEMLEHLASDLFMRAVCRPAGALSETDEKAPSEARETKTHQSDKGNRLDLPIRYNKKDRLPILGKIKGYPELEALRSYFQTIGWYYWNGVYKLRQESEAIPILSEAEERRIEKPYRLKKADYEYIIAFVSPKKEIVDKAMNQKPLEDAERKQLAMVIYTPQEE